MQILVVGVRRFDFMCAGGKEHGCHDLAGKEGFDEHAGFSALRDT